MSGRSQESQVAEAGGLIGAWKAGAVRCACATVSQGEGTINLAFAYFQTPCTVNTTKKKEYRTLKCMYCIFV